MLTLHILMILLSYAAFFVATCAAVLYLVQDNRLKHKETIAGLSHLPDLESLDKLNYRLIGVGFPLLTISLISGFLRIGGIQSPSLWQNHRLIYSFALWLIYALILHVRLSSRMRGKKVAFLSVLAFCVIVITLLGKC